MNDRLPPKVVVLFWYQASKFDHLEAADETPFKQPLAVSRIKPLSEIVELARWGMLAVVVLRSLAFGQRDCTISAWAVWLKSPRCMQSTRFASWRIADSVGDGDTLYVGRQKIRLCGIDAPEKGENGYDTATRHLRALVAGKAVTCHPVGQGTPCDGRSRPTSHGRIVAQCFVGGRDIAAEMVRAGYARDWPAFSGGHYAK